ncbi:hypothetical protein [Perlabentimonas gracilis]|jgi:hypothetical protein|uniref:hypothetical protein n=1 Tax=Perlabentimonas gracilis TaxID=2715279 RepID=UPI00140A2E9E|nr:hypothetical protein [Perlabentimonas gracilis]NHB69872.1 hypothetical protein [Perlabentimonas gracilis]
MKKIIEVNRKTFLKRVIFVLKKIHLTAYIYIIFAAIILFLLSFIISAIFILVFFAMPVIYESRIYLFKVESYDDFLVFHYLKYNKSIKIKTGRENIKIIRYNITPIGSKTGRSFKVVKVYGKGNLKKILKQYEIIDWADENNIEMIKNLIT